MTNLYRPSGDLFNQQSSLHCRTPSESLPGWSDLTGVFLLYCLELPDGHPIFKNLYMVGYQPDDDSKSNVMFLGGNPKIDAIKMSCWRYMLKKGPPMLFGICIYIYIDYIDISSNTASLHHLHLRIDVWKVTSTYIHIYIYTVYAFLLGRSSCSYCWF